METIHHSPRTIRKIMCTRVATTQHTCAAGWLIHRSPRWVLNRRTEWHCIWLHRNMPNTAMKMAQEAPAIDLPTSLLARCCAVCKLRCPSARRSICSPKSGWIFTSRVACSWATHAQAEGLRFFPGMMRSEIETKFPGYHIPETITEQGWWSGGHEEHAQCEARAEALPIKLQNGVRDARHGSPSFRMAPLPIGWSKP